MGEIQHILLWGSMVFRSNWLQWCIGFLATWSIWTTQWKEGLHHLKAHAHGMASSQHCIVILDSKFSHTAIKQGRFSSTQAPMVCTSILAFLKSMDKYDRWQPYVSEPWNKIPGTYQKANDYQVSKEWCLQTLGCWARIHAIVYNNLFQPNQFLHRHLWTIGRTTRCQNQHWPETKSTISSFWHQFSQPRGWKRICSAVDLGKMKVIGN